MADRLTLALALALTLTPTLTLTAGAYFGDCLSLEDIDEMNIEIIRNTLYKAYLEDFHSFCQKARSPLTLTITLTPTLTRTPTPTQTLTLTLTPT